MHTCDILTLSALLSRAVIERSGNQFSEGTCEIGVLGVAQAPCLTQMLSFGNSDGRARRDRLDVGKLGVVATWYLCDRLVNSCRMA